MAATTTASTLEEDDLIDIDPPASRGADLLLSLTKATRHKPLVTPPLLDASSSSLLVVAGETGFSTNNNNSSNMVYNNASNNASNNNSRMRMMRPPDAENPHRMLYHSPIKVNPHNTTSSSACAVSEQHPNKLRKQPLGSLLTEPQNQYHHHPGVSSARNLPYGMGRQVPSWSPSCVPGRMGQQQAVFHASFGAASPTVSSSSANSNSVPKRLMLFADTDQRTVTVRSSPTVTTKRMRETKSEEKKDTEEGLVPDDDEEDEEEPQQQQPNHNMAEEEPPIVKQRLISPSSSNEKLEEADATPAPSTTTNTNTTTTSTAAATHAFVVDPAVPPLGFYGGHTLWPPPPHPNSMYHPTPPPPHAHPWPHAPYPGAAAYYHPHGPPPTPHYGTAYPYPSPGWGAVYSPGVFPPPDQQQQQQHPSRSSLRSSKDPWKGLTGGGGSSNNLNRCVPIANPVPNKYWS